MRAQPGISSLRQLDQLKAGWGMAPRASSQRLTPVLLTAPRTACRYACSGSMPRTSLTEGLLTNLGKWHSPEQVLVQRETPTVQRKAGQRRGWLPEEIGLARGLPACDWERLCQPSSEPVPPAHFLGTWLSHCLLIFLILPTSCK